MTIVLLHPENDKPWPSDHAEWVLHFENNETLDSFIAERAKDLGLENHRPFHLLDDYWELTPKLG
jgi:hypothetical protein